MSFKVKRQTELVEGAPIGTSEDYTDNVLNQCLPQLQLH